MTREILFRGMDINGSWHYGLLAESAGFPGQVKDGVYVSNSVGSPHAYAVVAETVGQYVGERDKHNVRIFEGDKIRHVAGGLTYTGVVAFVQSYHMSGFDIVWEGRGCTPRMKKCEIVGNVHEVGK